MSKVPRCAGEMQSEESKQSFSPRAHYPVGGLGVQRKGLSAGRKAEQRPCTPYNMVDHVQGGNFVACLEMMKWIDLAED